MNETIDRNHTVELTLHALGRNRVHDLGERMLLAGHKHPIVEGRGELAEDGDMDGVVEFVSAGGETDDHDEAHDNDYVLKKVSDESTKMEVN